MVLATCNSAAVTHASSRWTISRRAFSSASAAWLAMPVRMMCWWGVKVAAWKSALPDAALLADFSASSAPMTRPWLRSGSANTWPWRLRPNAAYKGGGR